jgi:hypothetical protein
MTPGPGRLAPASPPTAQTEAVPGTRAISEESCVVYPAALGAVCVVQVPPELDTSGPEKAKFSGFS